MPNNPTVYGNHLADETSNVGEKVLDSVSQVKDRVSDLGTAAANKIDEGREAAAGGLKKAATTMHENAGSISGGDRLTKLAHSAADVLDTTADYVRDHNTSRMMADVTTVVKNNPGPSLVAAAVVGFLIGRAFSSNNN
jgi:ElaB/YqjD/DUF883 family membrane-anchored ribosome-binding protein